MKKLIAVILILATLVLAACTEKTDENEKNGVVPENTKFLVGKWERVSETDTMYLNLKNDGGFSFYCACGNGVGNGDCYDAFEYREDEGVIRAFDSGDRECYQDYKLYMHGKNFIVIDVEGAMMEFWLKGASDLPSSASMHCAELIEGFTMCRTMTDVSETTITLTPPYYDGDVKEHREEKIEMKLTEGVEFSYFDVFTVNKDGEETSTYESGEMTLEDVKYLLDSTLGGGFVWLSEDLEVTKVLFYGELYNWE